MRFYPIPMKKEIKLALKEGDLAPDFEAQTHTGDTIRLRDLKGKDVLLYFYPRDDTPGCTKEACGFRDAYDQFKKRGAVILGVSADPAKAHQKFTDKFNLPFPLLIDDQKKIINAYGVWGEKTFMGRKYMGVYRVTFLIDKTGHIKKIWPDVKPDQHAAETLAALDHA
jgi:peroxiredoxin Q/BCP